MLHRPYILIAAALALAAGVPPAARAADEDTSNDKDLRGRFVRLFQHEMNGRKYVGLEVKTDGSRDIWRLLIPLKTDDKGELVPDTQTIARARRLKYNQEIEITYYLHEKWNWIRRLDLPPPKK